MRVIVHLSQLTWVAILAIPDSARSAPLHRLPEEGQQAASSLCTASPDSPAAGENILLNSCILMLSARL